MVKRPERLRGMADVLPETAYGYQSVLMTLRTCFERSGYQLIDVPIVEDVDLFLTKVGEEFIPKLYSFNYRGRTLCLRPEFTSSICRVFIDHYQRVALPLRFQYAGPVFRHDAPGRARFRQYTQAGVELFGGEPLLADAELILLALQALRALRITRYRLVLGHIGIVTQLLRQFALDDFARSTILNNLENLVKPGRGEAYVRARLAALQADIWQPGEMPVIHTRATNGVIAPTALPPDLQDTISLFLHSLGLPFRNHEEEKEVAERLARRLRAPARQDISQAIDFVMKLRQCAGQPAEAFIAIRTLLARYQLSAEPLAPLEQLVAMLASAGVDSRRIIVDPGLGRGLQYYTGLVFEIHTEDDRGDSQLCGGGRYDELTRLLGGPAVPACGFAFGVERLWLAASAETPGQNNHTPTPQALVIPISSSDWGYAMAVAERLRTLGLKVVVDIRQKGVTAALRRLARAARETPEKEEGDKREEDSRIRFALIVGDTERTTETVVVRDIPARQERVVPLADLGSLLKQPEDDGYAQ